MHPISVYVIYPYNLPFIVFYNKQGYNNLTNWNIGNTSIEIVKKLYVKIKVLGCIKKSFLDLITCILIRSYILNHI